MTLVIIKWLAEALFDIVAIVFGIGVFLAFWMFILWACDLLAHRRHDAEREPISLLDLWQARKTIAAGFALWMIGGVFVLTIVVIGSFVVTVMRSPEQGQGGRDQLLDLSGRPLPPVATNGGYTLPLEIPINYLYIARSDSVPDLFVRQVDVQRQFIGPETGERSHPFGLTHWNRFVPGLQFSSAPGHAATSVVVFVHGYANTARSAELTTAMIANYWPFPHAAFISYEWGSAGDLRRYEDDEATIARSSPKLRAFLEQLMEWSPRRPIFVVAHSMGSRAVMDALIGLQDRRKAWPGRAAPLLPSMRPIDDAEAASSTPILMTMLIAPDIGASEFASAFQTGKDAIWRATKYFMLFGSPADRALELSAGKHGAVRAGQGPDIVRNIPGIVYVDCARCYALDLFGHSYQADAARQVADSLRRTLGRKQ